MYHLNVKVINIYKFCINKYGMKKRRRERVLEVEVVLDLDQRNVWVNEVQTEMRKTLLFPLFTSSVYLVKSLDLDPTEGELVFYRFRTVLVDTSTSPSPPSFVLTIF